jgi:hypothetical protein
MLTLTVRPTSNGDCQSGLAIFDAHYPSRLNGSDDQGGNIWMSPKYASVVFTPNEFYERLINLRQTNPAAFARFASQTNERLRAYEEAKSKASTHREETNDAKEKSYA